MAFFRKKKSEEKPEKKKDDRASHARILTAEGWRRKREKETGIRTPSRFTKKGKRP